MEESEDLSVELVLLALSLRRIDARTETNALSFISYKMVPMLAL